MDKSLKQAIEISLSYITGNDQYEYLMKLIDQKVLDFDELFENLVIWEPDLNPYDNGVFDKYNVNVRQSVINETIISSLFKTYVTDYLYWTETPYIIYANKRELIENYLKYFGSEDFKYNTICSKYPDCIDEINTILKKLKYNVDENPIIYIEDYADMIDEIFG